MIVGVTERNSPLTVKYYSETSDATGSSVKRKSQKKNFFVLWQKFFQRKVEKLKVKGKSSSCWNFFLAFSSFSTGRQKTARTKSFLENKQHEKGAEMQMGQRTVAT